MKKNIFYLCLLLLALLPGCTGHTNSANLDAGGEITPDLAFLLQPTLAPHAPNIQLGNRYTSALNEECYEAYLFGLAATQTTPYCLRNGAWVALPKIYMTPPQAGAAANQAQ